jgi:hypothetical protein
MAQLVVGTPFWEKQAAEGWVSRCDDHPEDRVLYGALYAVLMTMKFCSLSSDSVTTGYDYDSDLVSHLFVLITVPYSHKSST